MWDFFQDYLNDDAVEEFLELLNDPIFLTQKSPEYVPQPVGEESFNFSDILPWQYAGA